MAQALPGRAQVVVIGGGVIGTSVAYHLTTLGWTDALTADRMMTLRRTAATAQAYQIECELISAEEAARRYPLLNAADLAGAIWLPADGRANPVDLTAALARGARLRGAAIRERVRVTGILHRDGRVRGVRTDQGDIEAEVVVNCA